MTEKKRYTYKDLHYMGMNEMLELVNGLLDENEQLKARIQYLEQKIQRERASAMKQHEKWEKEFLE